MNKTNKQIITIITILFGYTAVAQVGINTNNPQTPLHVDGQGDNATSGTPTASQQANDFVITTKGSVGVGTITPNESAIVELSSTNKGFLLPRVDLTSSTLALSTDSANAEGLIVYNTGTTLAKGFYFWDGAKWASLGEAAADPNAEQPTISGEIFCRQAQLYPPAFVSGEPYEGFLIVPYSDGNGIEYPSGETPINSTGITGLQATLKKSKLEFAFGELVYRVTGTPSGSTPTQISFTIPDTFTATGCEVTVGEEDKFNVGEERMYSYSAPFETFRNHVTNRPRMTGKNVTNVTNSDRALLSEAAGIPLDSPDMININGLVMDFRYVSTTLISPLLVNKTPNPITYSVTALSTNDAYINGVNTTIAPNATAFRVDGDGQIGINNNNNISEFVFSEITFENGEWYRLSYTANQIDNIVTGYVTATRLR